MSFNFSKKKKNKKKHSEKNIPFSFCSAQTLPENGNNGANNDINQRDFHNTARSFSFSNKN
jgi:hypothetical protein